MLQIQENHVAKQDNGRSYRTGESPWYEPFTNDLGRLFRFLQKEHGRCTSKIYQDAPDGTADLIGWVFEKRCNYEGRVRPGDPHSYKLQTWVTHRQVKE